MQEAGAALTNWLHVPCGAGSQAWQILHTPSNRGGSSNQTPGPIREAESGSQGRYLVVAYLCSRLEWVCNDVSRAGHITPGDHYVGRVRKLGLWRFHGGGVVHATMVRVYQGHAHHGEGAGLHCDCRGNLGTGVEREACACLL